VAQHGVFAGGAHRGEPARLGCEAAITNGIDASVDLIEAAASEPMLDCAVSDVEIAERFERDEPMLVGCNRRDRPVDTASGTFPSDMEGFVPLAVHAARFALSVLRDGARPLLQAEGFDAVRVDRLVQ
jgi:hypothetical protein